MSDTTETENQFADAAKLRGKLSGLVNKMTPEELAEYERIMAEALADELGGEG